MLYFKENIPRYTVLETRKKSYHPVDSHLYMISAKKDDGTYAVWICWNQRLKSLKYGHYELQSMWFEHLTNNPSNLYI